MRQYNLFALFCRLEHRQTNFQGCRSPTAAVKHRPALDNRIVQFFDFRLATAAARWQIDLALRALTVDLQPIRRLANVALLTTHHRVAEERLFALTAPDVAELTLALAAEAHAFF